MTMSDVLADAVPRSILGTPVGNVTQPATVAEAAEALRDAQGRDAVISFCGGGTELGLGYAPERVDLLLSTRRLDRVVDYAPADLVIEAEAGMTLAELQAVTLPHRQRLALDPPLPERVTLGGLVAANAFGPLRARFGTVRDALVGISLVRADGRQVRGGGKVVKNVAGFDLAKLMIGSLGTLALIARVVLRLHPLPEASAAVAVDDCTSDELRALERHLVAAQLEPSAFVAERVADRWRAVALFEGFAAGVAEQCERSADIVRTLGRHAESVAPESVGPMDATARRHGDLRVRFSVPPTFLPQLERAAITPLSAMLDEPRTIAYPPLGIAFLSGVTNDPGAAATAFGHARTAAERGDGNAILLEANEAVAPQVDPFGTPPSSFPLMRELKARFDPERRLNRGRFVGRL